MQSAKQSNCVLEDGKCALLEATGLPLVKTEVSVIGEEDSNQGFFALNEECGVFIPRELKGFVRRGDSDNETERRAVHEFSHGLYAENFPTGRVISSLDRQVYDTEVRLFGRPIRKQDRCLVVAGTDLPSGVKFEDYDVVAFLSTEEIERYRYLRNALKIAFELDLIDQEGFCTFMEFVCSPKQEYRLALEEGHRTANDVYGVGFRRMKSISDSHGLRGILRYLQERR